MFTRFVTLMAVVGAVGLGVAQPAWPQSNPCAPKGQPVSPANPCAAKAKEKAANPCNPCAAKQPAANPCNPCAAKNPCSGKQGMAPAGIAKTIIARVVWADPSKDQLQVKWNNQDLNLAVDQKTVFKQGTAQRTLSDLKAGEKVTVSYIEKAGERSARYVYLAVAQGAANPCNPCAAKQPAANPCNPCAAKNPCAPKQSAPANPCAAKEKAANPCAAK